jgi:hypothetical protein
LPARVFVFGVIVGGSVHSGDDEGESYNSKKVYLKKQAYGNNSIRRSK